MKPPHLRKPAAQDVPKQAVKEKFVKMNFSLQVVQHVIQENLAKNLSVVCSPASIDAVLRILAVGAENSTLAQLLELLGHADVRELNETASKLADALKGSGLVDAPEISYVNALWLDHRFSLKAEFEKVLRDVHKAQARVVDFVNHGDQVVKEANAWAKQETRGLIKQVLSRNDINKHTKLLLSNALYFKGTWVKSFESKDTEVAVFNLLDGHKVRIPFLNQWCENFSYGTFNECQVLRMPYKRGNSSLIKRDGPAKTFSMYAFLPYEKDGLPHVMKNIKIDENMFEDQVKLVNVEINKLSIPKFKFESQVPLKNIMKQLGLTLPFEKDCEDFSEIIDDDEPLYVSDICQKCCVETNEKGTEAAAVTFACLAPGCAPRMRPPPPKINFVADHPFMFMIREDVSGAILFVGTILDPR